MYYSEPRVKNGSILESREFREMFRYLRFLREKFFYFLLALVVLTAGFYFWLVNTNVYASKITFFTGDKDVSNNISGTKIEHDVARLTRPSARFSQVYSIVFSQRMLDHLVEKFNLMRHYGIDPAEPFAQQKVRQTLISNMQFNMDLEGLFSVIVVDHSKLQMTIDIANEIVKKSVDITSEIQVAGLQNSMRTYNALYAELKNALEEDTRKIQSATQSLRELIGQTRSLSMQHYASINATVEDVNNLVKKDYEQMSELNKARGFALKAMEETRLPVLYSLGEAVPQGKNAFSTLRSQIARHMFKAFCFALILALAGFFVAFESNRILQRSKVLA